MININFDHDFGHGCSVKEEDTYPNRFQKNTIDESQNAGVTKVIVVASLPHGYCAEFEMKNIFTGAYQKPTV
ncbi:MAG: hypothetical protein H6577_20500 [Lewinellaceae bacterium]|nr:hypothetical protein [Saprospiraceae bacterium]MCB9340511.1 hypothetical protein [Lewinellaceae bacterium]